MSADDSACFHYRVKLPLFELGSRDDFTNTRSNSLGIADFNKMDILYVQRAVSEDLLEYYKAVKRLGIKLIVDVDDDFFNIPPWNPAKEPWDDPKLKLKELTAELYRIADAIFVSTHRLKHQLLSYNPNIAVLHNSFDSRRYANLTKPNLSKKPVIGFTIGPTHTVDLETIKPLVVSMALDPAVAIKALGMKTTGAAWPGITFIEGVHFDIYHSVMNMMDWDLGLIGLAPCEFNEAKSPIKWMEYVMLGIFPIMSAVGPYKLVRSGIDGILCKTEQEWINAIKFYVENPDQRYIILAAARKRILENFSIQKTWKGWQKAITNVLNNRPVEDFCIDEACKYLDNNGYQQRMSL